MGWAQQEFAALELGDARRSQRLVKLVDDWSARLQASIAMASGG